MRPPQSVCTASVAQVPPNISHQSVSGSPALRDGALVAMPCASGQPVLIGSSCFKRRHGNLSHQHSADAAKCTQIWFPLLPWPLATAGRSVFGSSNHFVARPSYSFFLFVFLSFKPSIDKNGIFLAIFNGHSLACLALYTACLERRWLSQCIWYNCKVYTFAE